jgi:hypothetical protein
MAYTRIGPWVMLIIASLGVLESCRRLKQSRYNSTAAIISMAFFKKKTIFINEIYRISKEYMAQKE